MREYTDELAKGDVGKEWFYSVTALDKVTGRESPDAAPTKATKFEPVTPVPPPAKVPPKEPRMTCGDACANMCKTAPPQERSTLRRRGASPPKKRTPVPAYLWSSYRDQAAFDARTVYPDGCEAKGGTILKKVDYIACILCGEGTTLDRSDGKCYAD